MERDQRSGIVSQGTGLQQLTDLYPDGILGVNVHGRITLINHQAAHLLGCTVGEALHADAASVLRLQDHDGHSWLELNRPFEGLSIRRGIPEQTWTNHAGEEVLTTARLIRDVEPGGQILGISVALRSGRGRTRLDRERSDLVATVSHELRSPLSGVKGFVQVMLNRWEQLKDEQKKMMLQTVLSDADRLSRLITELLDVARIDTGRLTIAPRLVDADALLLRCVESVRASTARPLVHRSAGPELPRIWADPDKFTQVLTNLLENGVRHGEGTVTASTQATDTGVRLLVEDEGRGIPPELRRRVLTKYWTGGAGGSGLGLYIASGLVRAHGGTLEIGATEAGGARICLDWPGQPDDA